MIIGSAPFVSPNRSYLPPQQSSSQQPSNQYGPPNQGSSGGGFGGNQGSFGGGFGGAAPQNQYGPPSQGASGGFNRPSGSQGSKMHFYHFNFMSLLIVLQIYRVSFKIKSKFYE